jgi:hypothetical protein
MTTLQKYLLITLTAFSFQLTLSAQDISLYLNNVTVKTAMETLKRDYSYSFVFVSGEVNTQKIISINIRNETLDAAIAYILQEQNLEYEIKDKNIIVRKHTQDNSVTPVKKNYTLTGKVFDAANGEPLPGTNIRVENTLNGTTTDADGRFALNNVPTDTCLISVSYIGYHTQILRLEPSTGNIPLSVKLEPESQHLNEVVVTARKEEKVLQKKPEEQVIKMTPEALKFLPYLGEKDIFRSFQLMPGVSAANESNSGMYVRGGTPDQNLILYDGFTVYHVEHLHGFYSAFNTNAIKEVQLYKDGFEAKYGGRLSSVTEIASKDGNRNKFTIGGEVSLLSVNLYTEIPVGSKFTSLFAFRRSYQGYMWKKINELNKNPNERNVVSSIGGTMQQETPPAYFYDLNGKLTFTPTDRDKIAFSIFNGYDFTDNSPQFNFTGSGGPVGGGSGPVIIGPGGTLGGNRPSNISDINMDNNDFEKYGNFGISLRWDRTFSSKWSTTLLAGYSNFYATRDQRRTMVIPREDDDETVKSGTLEDNNLFDYSIKNDWKFNLNERHTLEFGAFATLYDIKYRYTQNVIDTLMNKQNNAILTGVYLQDKIMFAANRLKITPGVRVNLFSATRKPYFEPRLGAVYKLSGHLSANAATGVCYQFANRIIREDIMAGNTDFWILSDGADIPVSRSHHFNMGLNYDLPDYIFSVEGYYKRNYDISEYTLRYSRSRAMSGMLINGSAGSIPGASGGRDTKVTEDFYTGDGYATGMEFLAQKKAGIFRGWVSYSLGEVKNRYPEQSPKYYFANHDMTHEFKIVGIYMLGPFDLSATWIYATGRPYTAPLGVYRITSPNGNTESFYAISDKNSFRLPDYHRLDIGVNLRFDLFESKGRPHTLSFSLFNAYNRANVNAKQFQVVDETILESNINYLSIMPNLSLSLKF